MSQALDPVTENHLRQAADRLAEEFAGGFSHETIAGCMSESQLFVCVHNAGRSQMAARLLRLRSGSRINVRSARSTPAGEVNPAAVWALETVRRIRDEIDRRVQRLIGELLPDDRAPAS